MGKNNKFHWRKRPCPGKLTFFDFKKNADKKRFKKVDHTFITPTFHWKQQENETINKTNDMTD